MRKKMPTEKSGKKLSDFKGVVKQLKKYSKPFTWHIIFILIFSVLQTSIAIISPRISGYAITALTGEINLEYIFGLIVKLFVLYSVYALSSCIANYLSKYVSTGINYNIREAISEKMNKISIDFFQKNSYGDILSRVANDVDYLGSIFADGISQIVTSVIKVVGILSMMFLISPVMACIPIVMLPIMGVVISIIFGKSQKYFVEHQVNLGKINGYIEEFFAGHEIIKVFNAKDKASVKFDDANNKIYSSSVNAQFLSGLIQPIMNIVSNLNYIASCIVGGYLAVTNAISIGDIVAFITYSNQFSHPLMELSGLSSMIQQIMAAAERVFELLDAPEESNLDVQVENPITFGSELEFKNVTFGYTPEKTIIDDFSFKIKKGQTVAIVGETGAGKTTVAKLAMRFYDFTKGKILLDGQDITKFNLPEYRKLFGIVTQEAWLYNDTIMENIRYGNLFATDEQVYAAANLVGAHHFIESLPKGYNTVIYEGMSNISEGQKQLLSIARLAVCDSPILILDEATASIDTRTESCIQNALSSILSNRTAIIVAHRLSTIRNADVILVMKNGKLIESGNHTELMAKQGAYYDLYSTQFE